MERAKQAATGCVLLNELPGSYAKRAAVQPCLLPHSPRAKFIQPLHRGTMPTSRFVKHSTAGLVVIALILQISCTESRDGVLGPVYSQATNPPDTLPERFPDMAPSLAAVRLSAGAIQIQELTDAQLIDEVRQAGGRVLIGLKPSGMRRTRETGVVPAIDRGTALAARAVIRAAGAEIRMSFRHTSAIAATISPSLAPVIRNLAVVDYVEASFSGVLTQAATPPQDTSWGVWKILAPHVWVGMYGPPTQGEEVNITILDGGADSVHRLSGQWSSASGDWPWGSFYVPWSGNQISDCLRAPDIPGSCYDNQPLPRKGHGAHVAGTISGFDNQYGWIGIAPHPKRFASYKVCDDGGLCPPESLVAGLDWVLSSGRPRHIVNISIGYCRNYTLLQEAVARVAAAGALVIAAAGNYAGFNNCPEKTNHQLGSEVTTGVMWPARYDEVMAVSGTLENDEFAVPPSGGGGHGGGTIEPQDPDCGTAGHPPCDPTSGACGAGSRWGPQVDIAAPFWNEGMTANGQYDILCGTSYSAPVVAGVAALVWSRNQSWSAAQVRQRLMDTAVPYAPANKFGAGRVNALNAVHGYGGTPPPLPSVTVALTGPSNVLPNATCTWYANASGGVAPHSYAWEVGGQPVGNSTGILNHSNNGTSFTINILATDATGLTGANTLTVTVSAGANECLDQ